MTRERQAALKGRRKALGRILPLKAVENLRLARDEILIATRIEHDKALLRVMTSMMKDDSQLFKQFMDNDGFKRWMTDTVFGLTSEHFEASSP